MSKTESKIDALIGKRIQIARTSKGYSPEEMAKLIEEKYVCTLVAEPKLPIELYRMYEAGETQCPPQVLVIIGKILDVDIDNFFPKVEETDTPSPAQEQYSVTDIMKLLLELDPDRSQRVVTFAQAQLLAQRTAV